MDTRKTYGTRERSAATPTKHSLSLPLGDVPCAFPVDLPEVAHVGWRIATISSIAASVEDRKLRANA